MAHDAVVRAVACGDCESNVAQNGCAALQALSKSPPGATACVRAGAVRAITGVLQKHNKDACVQVCINAIWALRTMECAPDYDYADNASVVASNAIAAAIPTLVAGLKNGGLNLSFGVMSLKHVASSPAGQRAAVDAGVPCVIVNALGMVCAEDARNAFAALYNMAFLDSGRRAAVAAGAPTAIIASIRRHVLVIETVKMGLQALEMIVTGQLSAYNADALAAIATAMRTHPTSADLALHACSAIACFASQADVQADIATTVPEAIVAALQSHSSDRNVMRHGCTALCRIAAFPAGRLRAMAAGAKDAVAGALYFHRGTTDTEVEKCIRLAWSSLAVEP